MFESLFALNLILSRFCQPMVSPREESLPRRFFDMLHASLDCVWKKERLVVVQSVADKSDWQIPCYVSLCGTHTRFQRGWEYWSHLRRSGCCVILTFSCVLRHVFVRPTVWKELRLWKWSACREGALGLFKIFVTLHFCHFECEEKNVLTGVAGNFAFTSLYALLRTQY